jgi:hypothetical protein
MLVSWVIKLLDFLQQMSLGPSLHSRQSYVLRTGLCTYVGKPSHYCRVYLGSPYKQGVTKGQF